MGNFIERARQVFSLRNESRESAGIVIREVGRSFLGSLATINFPAQLRARRPYRNHPWVYSGVSTIAKNISQAPLNVVMETEASEEQRRSRQGGQLKRYRHRNRMAQQRFLNQNFRRQTGHIKGVEIVENHPLQMVLRNPNPIQTGEQLIDLTVLHLMLSGHAFWWALPESDTQERIAPGDIPARLWPLDPNGMEPVGDGGEFVGWDATIRHQSRADISPSQGETTRRLAPWEVIHFKFTDPNDLLGGLAPITAAANGITIDMLYAAHNRSSLENGATPGGILVAKQGWGTDEDAEKKFREKWEQRHQGENRRNRMAFLGGVWEYLKTGMTSSEMEYIEGKKMNREEVLAVLGIPKGIVSVTDDLNFAIAQTQERAFVDRTLYPIWRLIENTLDSTLLAPQEDNIFAAFDLSGIEALRLGLAEKIKQARELASSELHVPPALAFQLVGIDASEFIGSDTALVSPILTPVQDVLDPLDPVSHLPGQEVGENDDNENDETNEEERSVRKNRKNKKERHWFALRDSVFDPGEKLWARAWKKWVKGEKKIALQHFDEIAEDRGLRYAEQYAPTKQDEEFTGVAIDLLIADLDASANRLNDLARPTLTEIAEDAYEFTRDVDLDGLVVLEFDDPVIQEFLNDYQRRLSGTAPRTIQENLRQSLRSGVEAGETLAELRSRVGQIYDIAGSDAKTLQVARTETGSITNGLRQQIFIEGGFDEFEWSTAQDEHVRDSHNLYGGSGKHPQGFNYLTLTTNDGILEHPHDGRAPAKEVVNCRCALVVF